MVMLSRYWPSVSESGTSTICSEEVPHEKNSALTGSASGPSLVKKMPLAGLIACGTLSIAYGL